MQSQTVEQASAGIRFTAEATLGRLARRLRMLGFDTCYASGLSAPQFAALADSGRILLTRTRRVTERLPAECFVFIADDDPFRQMVRVRRQLGIQRHQARPFSRCVRCNRPVQPIDRDAVYARVPDYVWETHTRFSTCPQCGRIYWQGSHRRRCLEIIEKLFSA